MSLADAIEAVLGERIEGDWKRYRRRKWTFLGNSGIPTPSGRDSYHLFKANFLDSDKIPYDLTVAVDFPLRSIKPIDRLPDRDQVLIQQWLSQQDNGETDPHGLET